MKRKIKPAWRLIVPLLVLVAMVAMTLPPLTAGAVSVSPPNTHIDPIPTYVVDVDTITGTSVASWPLNINMITLELKYEEGGTWYYWEGSTWLAGVSTTVTHTTLVPSADLSQQWDWTYNAALITGVNDWVHGETYYLTVTSYDSDTQPDPTPSTDTFTVDYNIAPTFNEPNTSIDDIADPYDTPPTATLTAITGDADNSVSPIAGVIVQIGRPAIAPTNWWNGMAWGTNAVWLPATATDGAFDELTEDWKITTTTYPGLPEWERLAGYSVVATAVNAAGTWDSTLAAKAFTYNVVIPPSTITQVYMMPLPEYFGPEPDAGLNMDNRIVGAARGGSDAPIATVENRIQRNSDNKYWNALGDAWQAASVWNNCLIWGPPVPPPTVGHELWKADDNNVPGQEIPGPNEPDVAEPWVNGVTYSVWAQAQNGGVPIMVGPDTMTYDNEVPTSKIDAIPDTVYTTLNQVTGDADDTQPGKLYAVWVRIYNDVDTSTTYNAGDFSWNGVAWDAHPAVTWLLATPTDGSFNTYAEDWKMTTTTDPALPAWAHDQHYVVNTKAVDQAGNVEATDIEAWHFLVDIDVEWEPTPTPIPTPTPGPTPTPPPATPTPTPAPTATPTPTPTPTPSPTPTPTGENEPVCTIDDIEAEVNTVPDITGGATDDGTIEEVKVTIQRDSDDYYWDGDSWEEDEEWLDADADDGTFNSDDEDWEVDSADMPDFADMGDDETYDVEVTAKALDDDANWSDETTKIFIWDTEDPKTGIDAIDDNVDELDEITGTSSDTAPTVDAVKLKIRDTDASKYWDGNSWESSSIWVDATNTGTSFSTWKYTSVPDWEDAVEYEIEAKAVDKAGNEDATPAEESFTFEAAFVLEDIDWVDSDNSDTVNEGDKLVFEFSKPVDTDTLDSCSEVNEKLNTSAEGTKDYGTDCTISWSSDGTRLTVTLGEGETLTGTETVNPKSAVEDEDGNPDVTPGTGPEVAPNAEEAGEEWEFAGLAWWVWLIIGVAVIILIVLLIYLATRPKGPPGEEEGEFGEYEEGEEEF